jgi:hypothetical protein
MPSPFPGMDPFLEVNPRWPIFHGWFVRELARQSLPKAQQMDCWIDVERSVYQQEPSGALVLVGEPDVLTGLDVSALGTQDRIAPPSGVALADPQAVHEVVLDPDTMQRYKQEYLVVRELGQFQRVLAVVELLSFANKEGTYMPKYREKRARFLSSMVHFMEIDLLRAGDNISRDLFPELPQTPYFIFVARKTGMGRREEGYPLRLQDRLPTIGLPLGPGRPDLPLDLSAAARSAYDLSNRPGWIRYEDEPIPGPPLSPEDQAWVKQMAAASKAGGAPSV